jgi:hypothetical protein
MIFYDCYRQREIELLNEEIELLNEDIELIIEHHEEDEDLNQLVTRLEREDEDRRR